MITQFKQYERRIHQLHNMLLNLTVNNLQKQGINPPVRLYYEGDKISILENGIERIKIPELKKFERVMKGEDSHNLVQTITELASDVHLEVERDLINAASDAAESVGNVGTFTTLDENVILNNLRKLFIRFKDDDPNKPQMPTIFTSQEMAEKIKLYFENLSPGKLESFSLEQAKIIEEKFEEYIKDLKSRKFIND